MLIVLLSFATGCGHAAASSAESAPEAVVRAVYAYLLEPKRDFGQDARAQKRWLTASSRELPHAADRAAKSALNCPDAGPDQKPPDNSIFLDAWDTLSSCDVTGSKKEASTARVSVLCTWGPKTNYPGEQRRMTAVLLEVQGAWRIANIESHARKFSKENTLVRSLQSLETESNSVSANCSNREPGRAK